MLSNGDLTSMRSTAGAALPDTAVLQTQTFASDGGGGGTSTWTASGTTTARLNPISVASEEVTGGRLSPTAQWQITMPYDADVTSNHRVILGGGTFSVEAVRDRSWQIATVIEAREVT